MQPPIEIESTRAALGAAERVWGWEIPTYLFFGGLVAGLMLAVAASLLLLGPERITRAMRWGLVAAPLLLSVGMLALFVDLTAKLHVFRFYTTFRPSAPMSLGSWVLLFVYPVQLLLILALPPEALQKRLVRVRFVAAVQRFATAHLRALALVALVLAVALGVYTGVLLSTTVARPLWSSGALGVLFLASGASTGVAALMLGERDRAMSDRFARADIALILLEVLVMVLWLAGLASQGPAYRDAAASMLVGPYAPVFLGMVVFGGLVVPAVLEALSLRGRALHSRAVPALV
ncbi:MAG: polysulfide reductase NrfD, partial [Polyangiaceae bacterium]|nr:polysulfide reductase NrfD [Polyangiaceae bacterium]